MFVYEAFGAGPVFVAKTGRRRDLDFARPTWLSAVRDRLAQSAKNLETDFGWLTVCL
jgi:hypothetical protein